MKQVKEALWGAGTPTIFINHHHINQLKYSNAKLNLDNARECMNIKKIPAETIQKFIKLAKNAALSMEENYPIQADILVDIAKFSAEFAQNIWATECLAKAGEIYKYSFSKTHDLALQQVLAQKSAYIHLNLAKIYTMIGDLPNAQAALDESFRATHTNNHSAVTALISHSAIEVGFELVKKAAVKDDSSTNLESFVESLIEHQAYHQEVLLTGLEIDIS